MDKTMDNRLIYIQDVNKQNYPFCNIIKKFGTTARFNLAYKMLLKVSEQTEEI